MEYEYGRHREGNTTVLEEKPVPVNTGYITYGLVPCVNLSSHFTRCHPEVFCKLKFEFE